jgi:MFS family permease
MPGRRSGAFAAPGIVWLGWLILMAGANLATPLYSVYAQRFGFSSLVLTSVFATYAFVLVPALILFGRLSDRFGRRPIIVAGLVVACAALVLFAFASSVAWLYAARALQGLAVGMISGAATAALVELDPEANLRRAALLAGLAQAGGSALGPIAAGVLAEWAPSPLRLCFFVGLGVTVVSALALLVLLGEPEHGREPWRIQRPRVPAEIRARFARVGLTAATAWAVVALYLSIVPSYASGLLHTHDLALLAAVAAVALVASFAAQVVSQRWRPSLQVSQAVGLAAIALGLVILVIASPLHSLALLIAGGLVTGAGHGVAFLNAQEELNHIAPDEHRGEVTAAFIGCIYALVATSVITAGLLAVGVSLAHAVAAVSLGLLVLAVWGTAWQLRVAAG